MKQKKKYYDYVVVPSLMVYKYQMMFIKLHVLQQTIVVMVTTIMIGMIDTLWLLTSFSLTQQMPLVAPVNVNQDLFSTYPSMNSFVYTALNQVEIDALTLVL